MEQEQNKIDKLKNQRLNEELALKMKIDEEKIRQKNLRKKWDKEEAERKLIIQ